MAIPNTKKALVESIQIHMANNFPSDESSLTQNQVLLYVDRALAFGLVGQVWQNAKLEGSIDIPEGYLQTFSISGLTQDAATSEWRATLPQPITSLPLGYSITEAYFADSTFGKSQMIFLIRAKRTSYRSMMPLPSGTRGWVDGNQIVLQANNGDSLSGKTLYVRMPKTKTDNINDDMIIPADAAQNIFDIVTKKLAERYSMPQDIINDGLSAGNKAS